MKRVWMARKAVLVAALALMSAGLMIYVGMLSWRWCPQQVLQHNLQRCPSAVEGGIPLAVAFSFWGMGLLVWSSRRRLILPEFFFLLSMVLATGLFSAEGDYTGGQFFYLSLAWLAPSSYRFHLSVLERKLGHKERIAHVTFLVLALVLSLPLLVMPMAVLRPGAPMGLIRVAVRLSVALALLTGMAILARGYRKSEPRVIRDRIRVMAFGTVCAFIPLVLLSLLPDTLGAPWHMPYEITFPWLLLSPLAYIWTLFRHRMVRLEATIVRSVVYYLLAILLFSAYLLSFVALTKLAKVTDQFSPVDAMLALMLLALFVATEKRVRRLTHWAIYGKEINHLAIVNSFLQSLAVTLDRETLYRLLVRELPVALQASGGILLLRDQDSHLVSWQPVGATALASPSDRLCLPLDGALATFLARRVQTATGKEVVRALRSVTVGEDETHLLSFAVSHAWVPFITGGAIHGLLLVQREARDGFLNAEDLGLLSTLAHPSAIAIHNVELMEKVALSKQELAYAHQQILARAERERRHMARELHDGAVQQLIGVSYRLTQIRQQLGEIGDAPALDGLSELGCTVEKARHEVKGVVQQLRDVIGELRPAGLEELGLELAIHGCVARLKGMAVDGGPSVSVRLGIGDVALPDSVNLCLFRVAQEALRNTFKHARANTVSIVIEAMPAEIRLEVRDDGSGFNVPSRLSLLSNDNHFGLIGIAELVASSGGQLAVHSRPSEGTSICVSFPLKTNKGSHV